MGREMYSRPPVREMRARCAGDAREMRGRCAGDAREVHARCTRDALRVRVRVRVVFYGGAMVRVRVVAD